EELTQNGNEISITWKDPWPSDVNQGVFDLELTVDEVEHSKMEPITWELEGEETSIEVVIRKPGDEFANVSDDAGKGVDPGNLDSFVVVEDDTVTLNPDIEDVVLNYNLWLTTEDALENFPISDALPDGFGFVDDSFSAELTSWDEEGL